METITSEQIKQALQRAKTDAVYGAELQKRLETGRFDTQLAEIGIQRTGQGLQKIDPVEQKTTTDTGDDIRETVQGVKNVFTQAGQTVADAKARQQAGGQTGLETAGQALGASARAISGTFGEVVKGGVKAVLPERAEEGLKSAIETGIQAGVEGVSQLANNYETLKETRPVVARTINLALGQAPDAALLAGDIIQGYQTLKETNPRAAANIDALLGIGELGLDVATLGVSKPVAMAVKEGAEQVGKQVGKGVVKAGAGVGKAASATGKAIGSATGDVGRVVSDIVPSKTDVVSGQITKALDLTAGDVSNIKLSTGNDVGEFIARNNLIGNTKEETLSFVKDITDTQYKQVRDEIKKVAKVYDVKELPRVRQSLELLAKQVQDVPGLEDVAKNVKGLLKKKSVKLTDVQKTKELLDDQFMLFKATGDVKEGTVKKGLAKVRKDVKQFIEKEVKDTTGADISKMNNDVATGSAILKLGAKRATRGLTRANVSLSDLTAFTGGSIVGTPLVGAAALFVKRAIETPTVRLRVAKILNAMSAEKKRAVQKQLLQGKVPEVLKKAVKD